MAGTPDGPTYLPKDLQSFWKGLFSRPSNDQPRRPAAIRPTLEVSGPITVEETEKAIKTTKPSTIPGPDGRRREEVATLSSSKLEWAFNSMLHLKDVPQSWAMGRTTLLPKKPGAREASDFAQSP